MHRLGCDEGGGKQGFCATVGSVWMLLFAAFSVYTQIFARFPSTDHFGDCGTSSSRDGRSRAIHKIQASCGNGVRSS